MTISLSDKTQAILDEMLKTGEFDSADAAVLAALEAFHKTGGALTEDDFERIDRAEGQIERGEVHDWSAVRDRIRTRFISDRT